MALHLTCFDFFQVWRLSEDSKGFDGADLHWSIHLHLQLPFHSIPLSLWVVIIPHSWNVRNLILAKFHDNKFMLMSRDWWLLLYVWSQTWFWSKIYHFGNPSSGTIVLLGFLFFWSRLSINEIVVLCMLSCNTKQ